MGKLRKPKKNRKYKESWKPIKSRGGIYAKFYDISTDGRIHHKGRVVQDSGGKWHTIRERISKYGTGKSDGYPSVVLYDANYNPKTILIHILVMEHFGPPPKPGQWFVNHIDENKQNCCIHNLEWASPEENVNHGTAIARRSAKIGRACACIDPYTGKEVRRFTSRSQAAEWVREAFTCRCNSGVISNAIRDGRIHYGLHWVELAGEAVKDSLSHIHRMTLSNLHDQAENIRRCIMLMLQGGQPEYA